MTGMHATIVMLTASIPFLGAYRELRKSSRDNQALRAEIHRLRDGIMEIAEDRPMAALTRHALRKLVTSCTTFTTGE